MRKFAVTALAAVGLSATALAPAAAALEVTLRLHTFLPPVANPVKHFMKPWAEKEAIMKPWAEKIEKESNGRLKI